MDVTFWIILAITGGGVIGLYLLWKYFKSDWKPYLAVAKQIISLIKVIAKSIDKDPNTLSTFEIFVELLDRGFHVVEDVINKQEELAEMSIDERIAYVREKVQTAVDDYIEMYDITFTDDNKQAINTVLNILDFFLKLLLPKI